MLSPVDIQNKEFKKATIGGYNTTEVNEFVEEVLEAYQTTLKENYELKDKMNLLNENLQYYRTMESTIQNALVLAEKTAQDTKTLAYEKADQIKRDAEYKAENVIENSKQELYILNNRIEELKKQYLSIKVQIRCMLQGQLDMIEQEVVAGVNEQLAVKEQEQTDKEWTEEVAATDDIYYTKEIKVLDEEEV